MEPLRPGDPEQVGGYTCFGRLGAGGMGQVFLARAGDGALVALKLIHPDLAGDPSFRAGFAREVAAIRRVSGPHTAPLLDAGDTPRPWLAVAYLPGLSLEEAVTRHGPLSVDATRRLGAALAEALDSIHRAGVVHRDLKPGNILLTADGPRVVDFGIAADQALGTAGRAPGAAGRSTVPYAGTPAYMAPEYSTGGPVTFPADVYALGGVLVFCRTGAPPLGAAPSTPPDSLDRIGDEGLARVITACLDEDPARRPSTEQLVAALPPGAAGVDWLPSPVARDVADRATSVPGPTRPRPATGAPARRRALLRATGVGAAAVAGAAAVRPLARTTPAVATVLWTARATMVSGSEAGPELARGLLFLDRTIVTRSGAARLDLCRLDRTGSYEWRRPLAPFKRKHVQVTAALGSVWVRSREELHLIDPDTGLVRGSWRRRFGGMAPAVTPGDSLVYDVAGVTPAPHESGTVHAHEPRTGRVVWQRRIEGWPVGPLVVAGNVLYVISASAPGRWEHVHALDAATGAVHWISAHDDDDVVQWKPVAPRHTDATFCVVDGTVYISYEGRLVQALDARTGATRWRIQPRQLNPDVIAPDVYLTLGFPAVSGNTLFLATGDGLLRAFDRWSGRQRWAAVSRPSSTAIGVARGPSTPLVGDGLAFVRSADTVQAIGAEDGRVRWERGTDPSAGEPVLAAGALHVPSRTDVTSYDPSTGRAIQRLDLSGQRRRPTALVPGREALYVLLGVDTFIAIGLPA
ncbi:serine/threonine-protein kinase [Spirillospora sp. NBC_00431]